MEKNNDTPIFDDWTGEQIHIPLPIDELVKRAMLAYERERVEAFTDAATAKLWERTALKALTPRYPFGEQPVYQPPPPRPVLARLRDWLLDKWPLMWKQTHEREMNDVSGQD